MNSGLPNRRGGRAYHSILAPHLEAIRQWRRERKTWQEIADLLALEKGVRVTLYAPYRFLRRRLRRPASWEDAGAQPPAPPSKEERRTAPAPALPASGFKRPDPKSFTKEDYL